VSVSQFAKFVRTSVRVAGCACLAVKKAANGDSQAVTGMTEPPVA
jgi:hypothetical protein